MAYSYSNPYQSPSTSSFSSRATDQLARKDGFQVFFGGLPADASDREFTELILSGVNGQIPLRAATTHVKCLYSSEGTFTGSAVIQVGSMDEAEAIRQQFSGQLIDATYRLTVQHMLPPNQPYPTPTIPAFPIVQTPTGPAAPSHTRTPTQPKAQQQQQQQQKGKAPAAPAKANGKPAGLQLLARISKPGQTGQPRGAVTPKEQAALLARQKANLKNGRPGDALLSRLARPNSGAAKAKAARNVSGTDKVARAKANVGKNAMDIDGEVKKAAPKKEKTQPKTQADLDAEMALWERQRRFAT